MESVKRHNARKFVMNNEYENLSIRRDLNRSFKPNTNIRLTTKASTLITVLNFDVKNGVGHAADRSGVINRLSSTFIMKNLNPRC